MTRSRRYLFKAMARRHLVRITRTALAGTLCACTLDFPEPTAVPAHRAAGATSLEDDSPERSTVAASVPAAPPSDANAPPLPALPGQDPGPAPADPPQPDSPGAVPAQANAAGTGAPGMSEVPPGNLQTAPVPSDGSTDPPSTPSAVSTADAFVLTPVDFPSSGQGLSFPDTAVSPYEQSPAFKWSGVPQDAKSLALVFRDRDLDLVRWLIWDIPPTVTELPADITPVANPPEVPGSAQLGSVGTGAGYSPPRIPGAEYEFTLWALNVQMLPDTAGWTADQILTRRLPMHVIGTTQPVVVINAP